MRELTKRVKIYEVGADGMPDFSRVEERPVLGKEYDTIYWIYTQLCQLHETRKLTFRTFRAQLRGERTLKELPRKALEIYCSENALAELRKLNITLPVSQHAEKFPYLKE